jgi:FdhD/NarQ family
MLLDWAQSQWAFDLRFRWLRDRATFSCIGGARRGWMAIFWVAEEPTAIRDRMARAGAVLLTSRLSIEMVQKTTMIGGPVVVAVSAPTTLAIETADRAGITLIAVARDDECEI